MANDPAENRDVRGNDINPATIGARDPPDSIHTYEAQTGTIEHATRGEYPESPRMPDYDGPLSLRPHGGADNPVITGSHVTDFAGTTQADPFGGVVDGTVYLFYEATDSGGQGNIVYSSSPTGLNDWTYGGTVVDESFHLSYPYWFEHDETYHLSVSNDNDNWRLYEFTSFPDSVSLVEKQSINASFRDPTPFQHNGTWYMLSGDTVNDVVRLHHADSLVGGSWSEHPSSPLWSDTQGKPGGRPVVHRDHIDVFPQVNNEFLRHKRLTDLSTSTVAVTAVRDRLVGASSNGWTHGAIHHMDIVQPRVNGPPLVFVDGLNSASEWNIGVFTVNDMPWTRLHVSDSQQISYASGAWTTIELDSVGIDTANNWDGTNYQYTVPDDGVYSVSMHVLLAGATVSGAPFRYAIRLRNTTNTANEVQEYQQTAANTSAGVGLSKELELTAGDVIEPQFFQESGASLDLSSGFENLWVRINRVE